MGNIIFVAFYPSLSL